MTTNHLAQKRITAFIKAARRGRPAHLDIILASRVTGHSKKPSERCKPLLLSDLEALFTAPKAPRPTVREKRQPALERLVRLYVKKAVNNVPMRDDFWEEVALSLELPGIASIPSATYDYVNGLLKKAVERVSARLD